MEFPEVFFFESEHEDEAAAELALRLHEEGYEDPFVLASAHGDVLASALKPIALDRAPIDAGRRFAADLGAKAKRAGAGTIVAIGGGRYLDVAKLVAARAGVPVVAVPTQLSHDGICSPVAVVPNGSGRTESLGAVAPRHVFVSLPTITSAPVRSAAAGIGDLLANPLALRDWALAAEHGLAEVDQRAWDLSVQSFQTMEPYLDADPGYSANDPAFWPRLADALVLSGMAMICDGTSRPASGGEHEISHAIDGILGGRTLHGAQVAFGCIISAALYGENTKRLRARLRKLGLPQHPADLDLEEQDVVKIILAAPDTRPGRFTIIEESDLDETKARALVRRIWGNG